MQGPVIIYFNIYYYKYIFIFLKKKGKKGKKTDARPNSYMSMEKKARTGARKMTIVGVKWILKDINQTCIVVLIIMSICSMYGYRVLSDFVPISIPRG